MAEFRVSYVTAGGTVRIVTTELNACGVCMFEDAVGNAH
jgi:hypothetical protein